MVGVASKRRSIIRLVEPGVRLIRLFSMGMTLLYPLVGLATAGGDAHAGDMWVLIAVGVLFHVYADMANDVIDLPLDRTDPRRSPDPLVRGLVAPQTALTIALTAMPLMALLLASESTGAVTSLAAAVILLGGYNVAGKTLRIPFLADFAQGAGWAAMVLVGSWVGGGPTSASWWAAGFVVCYIAMVNGVHGAVRDVENDRLAGASTTAVLLGARVGDGGIGAPPAIVAYAVLLHGALGAALAGLLVATRGATAGDAWRVSAVVTLVSFLASISALWLAYRRRSDLREAMAAGTWHLFLTPIALLAASTWTLGAPLAAVAAVAYLSPPFIYGRVLGEVDLILPSTRIGRGVAVERDSRARRSGLWTMSRIGVPLTCAMLVLIGARLSGRIPPSIAAGMVATGLSVVAANVFNDRCDVVADRINRPHRPIPSGAVTENEADRFVLAVSCAAFAVAAVLGAVSMVAVGVMLVIGLAYSLVLRRVVGLAQVAISILFTMPIFYGGLISGGVQGEHWLAAGLVSIFVFARETIKVCFDRRGDVEAGYQTIATRFGTSGALSVFRLTAIALITSTMATAALVKTVQFLIASVVCIVIPTALILALLRRSPDADAIERAIALFGNVFALGLIPLALMV